MKRVPRQRSSAHLVAALAALALAGAAACSPEAPVHHRIDIRALVFQPVELEVSAGDTITWFNHDIVPHTVTEEGGADSGEIKAQAEFSLVAGAGDTIDYVCRYHPNMTGTLVVAR